MTRDQIKAIALARGFTERQQADGSMDLNGYVYAFAEAMYAEGQRAMQERVKTVCALSMIEAALDRRREAEAEADRVPQMHEKLAAAIRALEVKPS